MAMMGAKAFIDTNVLLRASVAQMPLHAAALNLIVDYAAQGYEMWISRQVIREYIAQVTRPQGSLQPLTPTLIQQQVAGMLTVYQVADENASVTAALLKLVGSIPCGGRQIHDANIMATMLVYGLDTLLTHNIADMQRFAHLVTIVPLKP